MTIERICDNCGIPYIAKRSTSKFCKTNCRVEYMRKNHMLEANISVAMETISQLGQKIDDHDDAYYSAIFLDQMRKQIDKFLPKLSSWWKCDNCGKSIMAFIPKRGDCTCGIDKNGEPEYKWNLVK
jgi:hypothetical protein